MRFENVRYVLRSWVLWSVGFVICDPILLCVRACDTWCLMRLALVIYLHNADVGDRSGVFLPFPIHTENINSHILL